MPGIIVRHGETSSNTPGKEKLRGQLPIALTVEGMKHTEETAKFLAKIVRDVRHVYTSPLVRAVQSANEIGEELELEITPRDELRDWDTGDFAGRAVTPECISELNEFIKHPERVVPGGESYTAFKARISPLLRQCVRSKDQEIVVVHGRVMALVAALSKGKGRAPDLKTLLKAPPVDPCGMLILDGTWKVLYKTPQGAGRQS